MPSSGVGRGTWGCAALVGAPGARQDRACGTTRRAASREADDLGPCTRSTSQPEEIDRATAQVPSECDDDLPGCSARREGGEAVGGVIEIEDLCDADPQ